MKRWILIWSLFLGINAGCENQSKSPPPASEPPLLFEPTRAQAKLPTIKLWLGAEELVTEIARTQRQQQIGMMFRTNMGENEGMIFVFDSPRRASFFMKNTVVPLTCAYIDSEGRILEIYDMTPGEESPIFAKSNRIRYVLETRQGWFARHGIGPGTVVRSEKGTLEETFFGNGANR